MIIQCYKDFKSIKAVCYIGFDVCLNLKSKSRSAHPRYSPAKVNSRLKLIHNRLYN